MTVAEPQTAQQFITLLESRRSVPHVQPGFFPASVFADLEIAVSFVPSAFNAQPWHVIIAHERNGEFWDRVTEAITERLDGDRRDRYLTRAENMRHGGMTLLIFEDLVRSAPQDGVTAEDARDHAVQALGMLQIVLWLTLSSYGLSASPQHWHWLLEDIALAFAGLPDDGFRLVAFMPAGRPARQAGPRAPGVNRVSREQVGADLVDGR